MYLTICSVVKNELFFLREFLEFHILQGVEHFFITDNGSTDGTIEILEDYKRRGLVTYIIDKQSPIQFVAYNYWLNYVKGLRSVPYWMAFIDVDEFLYCGEQGILEDVILNYEGASSVAVHWVLYGSKESPGELVIERFQHRAKEVNHHVKAIVQPKWTKEVGRNPHHFILDSGYTVDENKYDVSDKFGVIENGTANRLRINHYHIKSWPEYLERKSTKPDPGTNRFIQDIKGTFDAHDVNEVHDASAAYWASDVKRKLE